MAAFPAFIGLLMAALVTAQNVEITPMEAVRRIGDEVTVVCKVAYPIDSCRMMVGGQSYRLMPSFQEGDVVYAGQGLQFGECGALIRHIREEWNGNVTCVLPPKTGSIELIGIMKLQVARAPGEPILIAPRQPTFREGDRFSAQCIVPAGRPAAKITWFLDDEQILTDIHQPNITSEGSADLQTISQNISRTLTADDGGKRLSCKVEHEALTTPIIKSKQIIVHYPPKRLESGPITIFGLKLGAPGRLNVTLRSNPPPAAEWTVADEHLAAPMTNHDQTVTALEPQHLGKGYYNVSLIVSHVDKEAVDRTYYLRVRNDLGVEEFAVRISTMDEPAGVELDTGAIVGIVIGVLVLLIAIFLIVFAKATDRWCFAGKSDSAKISGESTPAGDVLIETGLQTPTTPGAEANTEGRAERAGRRLAELSARVRAALPKGRSKPTATDAANDHLQPEEKKGVVYAELALSEQPTAEKPPPPSTEYAEIVYTDQQKEAKESV